MKFRKRASLLYRISQGSSVLTTTESLRALTLMHLRQQRCSHSSSHMNCFFLCFIFSYPCRGPGWSLFFFNRWWYNYNLDLSYKPRQAKNGCSKLTFAAYRICHRNVGNNLARPLTSVSDINSTIKKTRKVQLQYLLRLLLQQLNVFFLIVLSTCTDYYKRNQCIISFIYACTLALQFHIHVSI